MSGFPAVVELSALDGSNGYRLVGVASIDFAGYSVASAGDVNGDGIDDFIIGAPRADPQGNYSGASYVIFGDRASPGASLSLSALDGTNGFRLSGGAANNWSGFAVSSAGDFNGDGFADLVVGARQGFGPPAGPTFVVFGGAAGFPASIDLTTLNGTNGFRVIAEGATDTAKAVSAGDINGDGLDDLILGIRDADVNASNAGATYVIFGQSTPIGASFNLSALDGTNGFRLVGATMQEISGASVASAGDVNGDGIDDLIIGAPNEANPQPGSAFVVFGHTGAFSASTDLHALDGTNGFRLTGVAARDATGWSVSSAGDLNNDGFDDVAVVALAGKTAYIVFGHSGGFAANLNLADLNGSNGFSLTHGINLTKVASAGDVNGDGIGDLIVSAAKEAANGANSGSSYVVYGRTGGFGTSLALSSLDGSNGFRINGARTDDYSGYSVAGAGDVNGDGIDDLLIGAPGATVDGVRSGAAYIVYGVASSITWIGTDGPDNYSGGAGDDYLSGGGGFDVLHGGAGRDTLLGGDARDVLYGEDNGDLIYGGAGNDLVFGGNGGDVIYGEDDPDTLTGGEGADKLFGGAGNDILVGDEGNDRLDGGAGIDGLTGGEGNDYLDGGADTVRDSLSGGAGNDIYIVGLDDTVTEQANAGYDIARASETYTLTANVEALQMEGAANIDGTGNGLANNLQGNSGDNRLDGGLGVDTINGGDGDDIIIGGLGNDLLRGGLGADIFRVAHSATGVLETDQVYDFSAAEGDSLDLSGAYAGTLALVSSFGKHAGEMTLTFSGGLTTLRLDLNGDGKADYQMKINGDVTAESGDWLL
ncbi:hypothetical protein [Caulobacter sp. NIBR1757]|uniref:hypothetical protein n=1 Tax=Caulobacter sp. NIBR1757 TaxID=3016000 RepID=UPI0022F075FA|nr:hypothetical protein [Caulobacter sp. NIBR1757]WGM40408.1 hypothetical protein AMEJIAPC_03353 [Caulobacter sp. NIBR1757]